jgi:hypothetical protein
MARSRHPNKEIEAALQYAEARGWRVVGKRGHAWGQILCSFGKRGGCIKSVYSTPKDPYKHALQLRQYVDNCPHIDE